MELKRSRQVDSRHEEHKKASHAHIICPGGHIHYLRRTSVLDKNICDQYTQQPFVKSFQHNIR
jgi:hypothetical protein